MARSTCLHCNGFGFLKGLIRCIKCNGEGYIVQQPNRYSMCKDQPAQIDCRNTTCKWHVNATCTNISPAITLTTGNGFSGSEMHCRCWSYQPKTEDNATDQAQPTTGTTA